MFASLKLPDGFKGRETVARVSLALGILAHRTSEDELSGCTITETKRKVFRFHETILRR